MIARSKNYLIFAAVLVGLVAVVAGVAVVSSGMLFCPVAASGNPAPRYLSSPAERTGEGCIVFMSDTQSPMWLETLLLRTDENEKATRKLMLEVARDSACSAVVHLGDITSRGGCEAEWQAFDVLSAPLRRAGTAFFPIPGNHDYYFNEKSARRSFRSRFSVPEMKWYTVRFDSLAVVLLNSNFNRMDEREAREQDRWLVRTLASLDRDPSVALIVVGCHHSPYTNSTIVDPSREVQDRFVPAFLASRKARLFLSGHAHAFEHFRVDGKDFLVIGGGGGLLHPLLMGSERRWPDRFPGPERRMFHYLRCTLDANAAEFTVMMLKPGDGFRRAYAVKISTRLSHSRERGNP